MLYLYNRAGERRMSQLASQTNTLAIIAKTWVRAPKEDVDSLHTLAKNLGKSHSGLAPKVRERLRQLELPATGTRCCCFPNGYSAPLKRSRLRGIPPGAFSSPWPSSF